MKNEKAHNIPKAKFYRASTIRNIARNDVA